jgi:hypothetical protein
LRADRSPFRLSPRHFFNQIKQLTPPRRAHRAGCRFSCKINKKVATY